MRSEKSRQVTSLNPAVMLFMVQVMAPAIVLLLSARSAASTPAEPDLVCIGESSDPSSCWGKHYPLAFRVHIPGSPKTPSESAYFERKISDAAIPGLCVGTSTCDAFSPPTLATLFLCNGTAGEIQFEILNNSARHNQAWVGNLTQVLIAACEHYYGVKEDNLLPIVLGALAGAALAFFLLTCLIQSGKGYCQERDRLRARSHAANRVTERDGLLAAESGTAYGATAPARVVIRPEDPAVMVQAPSYRMRVAQCLSLLFVGLPRGAGAALARATEPGVELRPMSGAGAGSRR